MTHNAHREYTKKAYTVVQSQLTKKANSLGGSWTAESVGKVIWIVSILSSNGLGTLIPESPLLSSSQIIKLKNEKESDTLTDHVNQGRDKDNDELIHEEGNDVEVEDEVKQMKMSSKRKRK